MLIGMATDPLKSTAPWQLSFKREHKKIKNGNRKDTR
jgi:hypothetical protein